MDAKKTGALIATVRKEKGCTQKALAEKLHVSDKAVSRWETGKGFPDTGLLKPLSDALGISVSELLAGEYMQEANVKAQADHVIVETLQRSKKERQRGMFWFFLLLAVILVLGTVGVLGLVQKAIPVDVMINQSKTSIRYNLNKAFNGVVYDDLVKYLRPYGYEYTRSDGSERYVFMMDEEGKPILSYLHCSGEGMLFGFRIGDPTLIVGNEALGISGYSLREYLEEQGFQRKHDDQQYGRPTLIYLNGDRCHWFPYVKNGVYINICLSVIDQKLMAFDIGLCGKKYAVLWDEMEQGNLLTIEDPFNLLTEDMSGYYPQWEPVILSTSAQQLEYKTLYCYVNGEIAGKFEKYQGLYRFTVFMPNANTTVLVTPEEQKEE